LIFGYKGNDNLSVFVYREERWAAKGGFVSSIAAMQRGAEQASRAQARTLREMERLQEQRERERFANEKEREGSEPWLRRVTEKRDCQVTSVMCLTAGKTR
jgi:hypothetical protein